MRKRIVAEAVALGLVLAAFLISGCSDNATKPEVQKPRYPEATTKEIVISNLVKSYKDHNIDQFTKLLHADYIWYNQESDVVGGLPEYYTRAEDIQHTGNMFLAAAHTHPNTSLWLDKLELALTTGSWQQIAEANGAPCSDCWETTREYQLTLIFTNGSMSMVSNDLVKITIVAVDVGGQNVYRIIRCDDIMRP